MSKQTQSTQPGSHGQKDQRCKGLKKKNKKIIFFLNTLQERYAMAHGSRTRPIWNRMTLSLDILLTDSQCVMGVTWTGAINITSDNWTKSMEMRLTAMVQMLQSIGIILWAAIQVKFPQLSLMITITKISRLLRQIVSWT